MNNVTLIGRSTKEPELRYIPSTGNAVAAFSIAVDRDFTGKDGKKLTDFFNIVVWGKSAEYCSKHLGKGKLVAIKGNIQNRTYETKEGEKRYITEIVSERLQILEWEKNNTEDAQSFKPDEYSKVDFDESEVPF